MAAAAANSSKKAKADSSSEEDSNSTDDEDDDEPMNSQAPTQPISDFIKEQEAAVAKIAAKNSKSAKPNSTKARKALDQKKKKAAINEQKDEHAE